MLVTQSIEEHKPIFAQSALSNKKGVFFTGNNFLNVQQAASNNTALIPTNGNWLIFAFGHVSDNGSAIFTAFSEGLGSQPKITIFGYEVIIGFVDEAGYSELSTTIPPNNDLSLYILSRLGDEYTFYVNEIAYPLGSRVGAISPYTNYLEQVVIGQFISNDTGFNYFNGTLGDIGVMGNHTTDDIAIISQYFKNFYGIVNWEPPVNAD